MSFALAALLCASPALVAQRGGGIELHGVPASVTSPRADGRPGGVAASVTDPGFGTHQGFRGSSFGHRHHGGGDRDVRPVYVVPAYGYYAGFSDDSAAYDDPQQQPQQQSQAIAPREEPGQSDDSSRYGDHYFDGRDSKRQADEDQLEPSRPAPAPVAAVPDDSPMTTLVYRDGHKSEVRNYAIVGSNLIDLTKSPVLKKIPLSSLDLVATRKENEDNGVDFHAP